MAITLADIRLQARQRADMVESKFVSDSELTNYVNASLAELHDLLIAAFCEEYYMNEVEFTAVPGQIEYDLPNGTNYDGAPKLYKLRGVDIRIENQAWITVKRFNFNRRNADTTAYVFNLLGLPYLEYRLVGSKIRFNRTPEALNQFRMWYYPVVTPLVNDTDEFEDVNGFIEYVVVDAAIKMLQKQEDDVAVLMAQKEALKARIKTMAQNRDANEPESVSDIYDEDAYFYGFRR
jgi:hypothetical protein